MILFEYGRCGIKRVLTMSNSELIIRPLEANEKYVAISHTWGDTTNTIEGIGWTVGSWICLETCKALVEVYNNVWIDSLCIKQNDELDKAAQIKNMHNIYGDAEDVVVVFTGHYLEQLDALDCLTQLFKDLKTVLLGGDCTSTPDCAYVKSFQEIRAATIIVREIPWFRRVWTLQEAIIPESLTFVGFEGGKLKSNVTTKKKLHSFIQAFEDVDANVWVEGELHSCTWFIIDPPQVWNVEVVAVVDSIRPINVQWCKYLKGQDRTRSLEDTADTVFMQLGHNNRDCKFMNDRVYAVCALLEIEIDPVDYHRRFEDVFLEAVKQVAKHGICALPVRPQVAHGDTWLPSLEHINLKDAWKTVGTNCMRRIEPDNSIVWEGDRVYAMGGLIQMHHPYKLIRTRMEGIAEMLQAIVEAECDEKTFDVHSIQDLKLQTITCVVLWMFNYNGHDTVHDHVQTSNVESLILMVYRHSELHMESFIDMCIMRILDEIGTSVSTAIASKLNEEKWTILQVVRWILEGSGLVSEARTVYGAVPEDTNEDGATTFWRVQLCKRDAILVAKENFGLLFYSVPSLVYERRHNYIIYGLFYEILWESELPKRELTRAHEILSNILVENNDGIWDNHGEGRLWSIVDVTQNIDKKKICSGTTY